jgi:hypothetical protein
VVLLIIGIGLGWYGLDQATATTVECGGHLMSPGDQCNHFGISNGNAYGDTGSYQDELNVKHRQGRLLLGVGAVITLAGGYLFYRRTVGAALRRRRMARAAAERGWTYLPERPGLLRIWREGLLSHAGPTAWHVLTGVANGREFMAFEYQRSSDWFSRAAACVVSLPFEAPEVRVVKTQEKTLLLWPSLRGERTTVATGHAEFDSQYSVLAVAAETTRSLLTNEVIAHVLAHQLTFALDRQWLIMIWRPRRADRKPAALAAGGGGGPPPPPPPPPQRCPAMTRQ